MRRKAKLCVLIVIGIVFLVWLTRNIQYSQKDVIDCVAVCSKNGDIAFTYIGRYPVIAIYDLEGEKVASFWVDNCGGGIYNMWFDDNGDLHMYLGRKKVEIVCDRSGNLISQTEMKECTVDSWDGWEKDGSSYRTNFGNVTYVYDYQNVIECVFDQNASITIKHSDSTEKQIWNAN